MTTSSVVGQVHLLGVRHHGPGSARSVRRALEELEPDLVLVEGPPEADDLVAFAAQDDLVPPVALLAYQEPKVVQRRADAQDGARPDEPDGPRAAFWPFAVFSPEWQAMRWAARNEVPLRFIDLPAAAHLAHRAASDDGPGAADDGPGGAQDEPRPTRVDPLGALAAAAGYGDAERWWEDVMEHREGGAAVFDAVGQAMTAVREGEPTDTWDALREAHMRQAVRAALAEGAQRIAVVCGAWHVPALTGPSPAATKDAALVKPVLREVAKAKTILTWVPWSHRRLAAASGYGAGVESPGWYHHLFTVEDRPVERWLVNVAQALRAEDLPVSSAHVIEAVRLAETLAALRGRPATGLEEASEAVRAVLCDGDEVRHALVRDRVEVGDRLGSVPDGVPTGPLERDLAATSKRLRLPREALVRDLDLDLRKPTDLGRSALLHRLDLLGVRWGELTGSRGKGTFRESWKIVWDPRLAVDLVAAGTHGSTIEQAASGAVLAAARTGGLAGLAALVERSLLAELPGALPGLLDAVADRAAVGSDTDALFEAIPALARSLRYGDVRGTAPGALRQVLLGLVARARTALPGAVTTLDDDAAAILVPRLREVTAAVTLLDAEAGLREDWLAALERLADRDDLHGLVAGWVTRTLRDERLADVETTGVRLSRYLSRGTPARTAAAFVEGFAGGSGLVLVHDTVLLRLIDEWLMSLGEDLFVEVLPLLRRTFAQFEGAERRVIGEQVAGRRLHAADVVPLDPQRVAHVLPVLATILTPTISCPQETS